MELETNSLRATFKHLLKTYDDIGDHTLKREYLDEACRYAEVFLKSNPIGATFYYLFELKSKKIVRASGKTKQVLGIEPHNLLGKSFMTAVKYSSVPTQYKVIRSINQYYQYLKKQPVENYSKIRGSIYYPINASNGELKYILQQNIPVISSEMGQIMYTLNLFTDITHLDKQCKFRCFLLDDSDAHESKLISFSGDEDTILSFDFISPSEQRILACVAKGLTSKEIADKLFLSIHTINNHKKNILKKLG
jgi:hypothetical protein